MSKEVTTQKIIDASAVLSLAKSLFEQLKALEDSKYDKMRNFYDSLVLLQTSIYSTLVLNLFHLLRDGEKHSITRIANSSVQHLGMQQVTSDEIHSELNKRQETIELLKENRDKRVAHFDKKNIVPLADKAIEELIAVAETSLKTLNLKALARDHSFGIPLTTDMKFMMEILGKAFSERTKIDL
jgi:hypothetical protein